MLYQFVVKNSVRQLFAKNKPGNGSYSICNTSLRHLLFCRCQYMTKTISFSASSGTHQGDRESQQDRVCLFRNMREPIALKAHLVIGLTAIAYTDQPHTIYASFLITSEGACHWAHVGDNLSIAIVKYNWFRVSVARLRVLEAVRTLVLFFQPWLS